MESIISRRLKMLTLKMKLGSLIIMGYNTGDCPSAYDENIYIPVSDQKEIRELGLR